MDDEVDNDFAILTGCLSCLRALKLDLGGIWSLFFPFDASGLYFVLFDEVAIGFTLRSSSFGAFGFRLNAFSVVLFEDLL